MTRKELGQALNQKLDSCFAEYRERMTSLPPNILFEQMAEVAATQQVYDELYNSSYAAEYLEHLIQLDDPLTTMREQWQHEQHANISGKFEHALLSLMESQKQAAPKPSPPETQALKLYYPPTVTYWMPEDGQDDGYGEPDCDEHTIPNDIAAETLPQITAALKRETLVEEQERGLMHYFHDDEAVDAKVYSAFPRAEVIDGRLWGVADCRITEPLTAPEMETFKEYWCGQLSDGFGEGFEQRGISCAYGEIFVSFWSHDKDWKLFEAHEMQDIDQPAPAEDPSEINIEMEM